MGSNKSDCPSHPLSITKPAAKTSFIGAMLVAVLYPLLCSDSPDESKETLQNNLSM
jgi:hypothetical protein